MLAVEAVADVDLERGGRGRCEFDGAALAGGIHSVRWGTVEDTVIKVEGLAMDINVES